MLVPRRYKYDRVILQRILFPVEEDPQPPKKRRRTDDGTPESSKDVDGYNFSSFGQLGTRSVILETAKESYLLSPTLGSTARQYDIALVLDEELEEDIPPETNSSLQDVAADKILPVPAPIDADKERISSDGSLPTAEQTLNLAPKTSTDTRPPIDKPGTPPRTMSPSQSEVLQTNTEPGRCNTEPTSATSPVVRPGLLSRASRALESSPEHVPLRSSPSHRRRISNISFAIEVVDDKPKQWQLQTLQQNLGEDMFRFTDEGVSVTDNLTDGMKTEWVVHVRRWRWGPS